MSGPAPIPATEQKREPAPDTPSADTKGQNGGSNPTKSGLFGLPGLNYLAGMKALTDWNIFAVDGALDKQRTPGSDKSRAGATNKDAAVAKVDAAKKDAAEAKTDTAKDAAETKVEAAKEVPDAKAPVPPMPDDFGSESVLRTWIGEFNKSLMNRPAKRLADLKAKGLADDNGLSYELLAAAAAKEPVKKGTGAPEPIANARILEMMAKNAGRLLFNVITPDYQGKCMQFTQQMLEEMGARRADKSDGDQEKRRAAMGPLTAKYRGEPVAALKNEVPAGVQICVTSMPEWGFTEVGNHWFISAGDGYYLDNTMGVTNGAGMTASLIKTTGNQWAARVLGKGLQGLREKMQIRFTDTNPDFKKYVAAAGTELETEGSQKIKDFVTGRKEYHPKIWLVEPTTKVDDS